MEFPVGGGRLGLLNQHFTGYKPAFTLSEVLISLVIIGVIAAITVPMLHAQYTEQERISRVKKTYSTLANAMTRVKADGGDMIFDVYNDKETIKNWYDTYLNLYLVTTKVCYNDSAGCWNEGNSYNLDGSIVKYNNTGIGIGYNFISAVLNDGTFIIVDSYTKSDIANYFGVDINTETGRGLIILFDINGSKKPNTIGKDIFAVVFTEDGLVPAYKNRTASQISSDCSSSGTGYSCIQKYLKQ